MTTENKIQQILSRIGGCNVDIIKSIGIKDATMYVFDFSRDVAGQSAAIMYDDGTIFHLTDWQGFCPQTAEEIEDAQWISQDGKIAIMMDGQPRLL